ncbi:MAG TPA: hypothetical protein VG425_05650 [Casimicrobiaceae bacterium]|jgi:hypothetical protein|nr:hypothetical protein [Casimicrobiaceae bacterium]
MDLTPAATTVAILVAAGGLVGLLFLFASVRGLRRRGYAACAVHGLASLAFFLAAAVVALLGLNLLTYDRLTREQTVLRVHLAQAAPEQYNLTLTYPSGAIRGYVLSGDEWQIDARVLKWRAFANLLGFDSAYRLERISGRYHDLERERTAAHTVEPLHAPDRIDVWTLLRAWQDYVPGFDALYGSAIYLPMADGADYEVSISPSGLLARPLNAAARGAITGWH